MADPKTTRKWAPHPRHIARLEQRRPDRWRFPWTWTFHIQRYNALEARCSPKYVGPQGGPFKPIGGLLWRNGLAHRIWNKPHHYYRTVWPPEAIPHD